MKRVINSLINSILEIQYSRNELYGILTSSIRMKAEKENQFCVRVFLEVKTMKVFLYKDFTIVDK